MSVAFFRKDLRLAARAGSPLPALVWLLMFQGLGFGILGVLSFLDPGAVSPTLLTQLAGWLVNQNACIWK